ncbi:hypothetical protein AB0B94_30415 [Micromonospora sp. NPDC048986]|uniref:hypothetical protein n=1 Tax=Micromonospora sp. NPDC048986 TaxID=3155644 RepID=UPI0033C5DC56
MPNKIETEPADRSFVVWFDSNDSPFNVFHRDDKYASEGDDLERWNGVDQLDTDDMPWTWDGLCKEMDGLDGPYLLVLAGVSA